jgi:hypothetical protein
MASGATGNGSPLLLVAHDVKNIRTLGLAQSVLLSQCRCCCGCCQKSSSVHWILALEIELSPPLNLARRRRAGDASKTRGPESVIGDIEVRMISSIQEFSTKLDSLSFDNGEIPEHGSIYIDKTWRTYDITPLVAELIKSRLREGADIEPLLNASGIAGEILLSDSCIPLESDPY